MKKVIVVLSACMLLALLFAGWKLFGPSTYFEGPVKYLYIPTTDPSKSNVLLRLQTDSMVQSPTLFEWMANRMNYWTRVKPGKYRISAGSSAFTIVRLLRNGTQTPVNLIITKLRTREDLASLAGRKLECDSLQLINFFTSNDSLRPYGLDSNTVMTAVLPNTYTFFWNTTPAVVFSKFLRQYNNFWTPARNELARAKGLTPQTAYILASIVEEETNKSSDKGNIAGVYLNRMQKGMKLGADPTVKFALKDFGLKRVYQKHLLVESPYNTYKINGLPPGPICTPSAPTIDAVLNASKTDYLYFVARADLSGYSNFASTYQEHLKFARQYQDSLDSYLLRRLHSAKDTLAK